MFRLFSDHLAPIDPRKCERRPDWTMLSKGVSEPFLGVVKVVYPATHCMLPYSDGRREMGAETVRSEVDPEERRKKG